VRHSTILDENRAIADRQRRKNANKERLTPVGKGVRE
jgi:hypothetical protein